MAWSTGSKGPKPFLFDFFLFLPSPLPKMALCISALFSLTLDRVVNFMFLILSILFFFLLSSSFLISSSLFSFSSYFFLFSPISSSFFLVVPPSFLSSVLLPSSLASCFLSYPARAGLLFFFIFASSSLHGRAREGAPATRAWGARWCLGEAVMA
jgi:hypothetical protein